MCSCYWSRRRIRSSRPCSSRPSIVEVGLDEMVSSPRREGFDPSPSRTFASSVDHLPPSVASNSRPSQVVSITTGRCLCRWAWHLRDCETHTKSCKPETLHRKALAGTAVSALQGSLTANVTDRSRAGALTRPRRVDLERRAVLWKRPRARRRELGLRSGAAATPGLGAAASSGEEV